MDKTNILIFPAGTEIAFEIVNALKYSKFVTLYGGTSTKDHSEFVYKNLITGIPFVGDDEFILSINKVIDEYEIDYIYPAHDSVCLYLAEHRDEISARVVCSELETVKICRSKLETYKFFEGENFIPKTYVDIDSVEEYPVFVKPSVGQGSVGAEKIDTREQLERTICENDDLVICEYLPGTEYSVDCFTDRYGKLRVVKLRDRERIRAGISVRSMELMVDEQIMDIAIAINNALKFRGAWFFQVKKNIKGEYRLMEVSPRIPGTMGLSRNMGINFPLLTLFDMWGYDVNIIDNNYDILLDRAFYSAYKIDYEYDHVYIDFDDTLTLDNKVNPDVIRFLYQCINKGKKLHLISRHEGDLYVDMEHLHIPTSLFNDIMVIDKNGFKSDYITEEKAIFIDDSFSERQNVKEVNNIPVFDVDMIESLIDYRF